MANIGVPKIPLRKAVEKVRIVSGLFVYTTNDTMTLTNRVTFVFVNI